MKAEEYAAKIKALGLSLAGAGRFFRANERTSRRWADPTADGPPHAVALSLRLMEKHGETAESAEALMTVDGNSAAANDASAAGWTEQADGTWLRLAYDGERSNSRFGNDRPAISVATAEDACAWDRSDDRAAHVLDSQEWAVVRSRLSDDDRYATYDALRAAGASALLSGATVADALSVMAEHVAPDLKSRITAEAWAAYRGDGK